MAWEKIGSCITYDTHGSEYIMEHIITGLDFPSPPLSGDLLKSKNG